MILSAEDCIKRYGAIQASPEGGLLWKDAPNWIKPIQVPDKIVLRNYLGKPVYRIFCNVDMHAPLLLAFDMLMQTGRHLELATFDGAFNVRWVRGVPGAFSLHSWGVAIDFNAAQNPLGSPGVWTKEFIDIFKAAGFTYGGEFSKRPDPMHYQLSKLP